MQIKLLPAPWYYIMHPPYIPIHFDSAPLSISYNTPDNEFSRLNLPRDE